ncbi:MAG: hypothetical protein ACPG32_12005 [Akkermansiaceae bacterium]
MKLPLHRIYALAMSALCAPLLAQSPNQSTLTLVNEPGFNQLAILIDIDIAGQNSQTSTLTGTIASSHNINPDTHTNDLLDIQSATIAGSDVTFTINNILTGNITLQGQGLGADVFTVGNGAVDPNTNEFDAMEHAFTVNQGTISGTAAGTPINQDLAATPVTGTGEGTGTLAITHTGSTGTRANYSITLTLPVNVTQEIPTGVVIFGTELMARVTVTGTIKATGTTYVYLSPFLQWTEENGVPAAPFTGTNFGQVPNGLLWAMGYSSSNAPTSLLKQQGSSFEIALPAGGTASDVSILHSNNLINWNPASTTDISTGNNIIPMGSTGTITITPSGTMGFYRLSKPE